MFPDESRLVLHTDNKRVRDWRETKSVLEHHQTSYNPKWRYHGVGKEFFGISHQHANL